MKRQTELQTVMTLIRLHCLPRSICLKTDHYSRPQLLLLGRQVSANREVLDQTDPRPSGLHCLKLYLHILKALP